MNQVLSDKYNIAWFKIAECVSRGEKERALGVYRLLSHSLHDQAVVHQLEGDIFLAFKDDEAAIKRYVKAADVYKRENRMLEAAAVYEHLLFLDTHKMVYREYVIDIYAHLNIMHKVHEHMKTLFNQMLMQHDMKRLKSMVESIAQKHPSLVIVIAESLVAHVLHDHTLSEVHKQELLMTIGEQLVHANQTVALQQFLASVQAIDENVYKSLCDTLEQ
jgi:hypothetical protein